MDLEERIMELSRYGYACGQILAILLLETIEEENPALVRCMQGLNGGIGSSGDVPTALKEASRMLRKGGKLVCSDVTENVALLLDQCANAGFSVGYLEDLTAMWREYYLEALWTQDNVCLPLGKKFRYVLFVCEKVT